MTEIAEIVETALKHAGLPKSALAKLAGVPPETVTRVCRRGTGDFATVSRLVRSAGLRLAAVPAGPARPRVDAAGADARTFALHGIVAARLLTSPDLVRERALPLIRSAKYRAKGVTLQRLRAWEHAAKAGVGELVQLCLDASSRGNELRQVSPLAGIAMARERWRLEAAFERPGALGPQGRT